MEICIDKVSESRNFDRPIKIQTNLLYLLFVRLWVLDDPVGVERGKTKFNKRAIIFHNDVIVFYTRAKKRNRHTTNNLVFYFFIKFLWNERNPVVVTYNNSD